MAASKNPEALIKPHFFHERKTIGHGESVIAGCLKAASKKSLANPACYHRQSWGTARFDVLESDSHQSQRGALLYECLGLESGVSQNRWKKCGKKGRSPSFLLAVFLHKALKNDLFVKEDMYVTVVYRYHIIFWDLTNHHFSGGSFQTSRVATHPLNETPEEMRPTCVP